MGRVRRTAVQTVAVVRTAPEGRSDDPLAGLLAVYWRAKGDGSVVTVSTDIGSTDTLDRVAVYLRAVQE